MKKLIFCLAAISAVVVSAMPIKKEVTAAREVVAELMSDPEGAHPIGDDKIQSL